MGMPWLGMPGMPYIYICNFCGKEYAQTSCPHGCSECGHNDFRMVSFKDRKGMGDRAMVVLKEHVSG